MAYHIRWLLSGIPALVMASTVSAQDVGYRQDQLEVLDPPVRSGVDTHAQAEQMSLGRFTDYYSKAGKPAIALFWNRQLSENLKRDQIRSTVTTVSTEGYGTARLETKEIPHRVDGQNSPGLATAADTRFKDGFISTLQQAGVKLVDRNLMLRSAGLTTALDEDEQAAEMRGLQSKAEWLLELQPITGAQNDTGLLVTLKDVRTARLITEFHTDARPYTAPRAKPGFVAVSGKGFQRATQDVLPPSDTERGKALALELMNRVANLKR